MLANKKKKNRMGELLALSCLLLFANLKEISNIQICGDSKVVVDWIDDRCML